jgi:hypothetical protein
MRTRTGKALATAFATLLLTGTLVHTSVVVWRLVAGGSAGGSQRETAISILAPMPLIAIATGALGIAALATRGEGRSGWLPFGLGWNAIWLLASLYVSI